MVIQNHLFSCYSSSANQMKHLKTYFIKINSLTLNQSPNQYSEYFERFEIKNKFFTTVHYNSVNSLPKFWIYWQNIKNSIYQLYDRLS